MKTFPTFSALIQWNPLLDADDLRDTDWLEYVAARMAVRYAELDDEGKPGRWLDLLTGETGELGAMRQRHPALVRNIARPPKPLDNRVIRDPIHAWQAAVGRGYTVKVAGSKEFVGDEAVIVKQGSKLWANAWRPDWFEDAVKLHKLLAEVMSR